ncbi:MAG: recombinase family protein [Acidobacteriota bacterium]
MTNEDGNVSKPVGGIAPFGYRWQDGSLVVAPSEAQIRKLIFELFIKHKRKRVVAKLLNDLGYRTRRGSEFSDTTIDRLIRDTTAKGLRIENGKEITVEPVLSGELWQKANNLLGEKQTRPAIQLFVGVTFCDCGGKMIAVGCLEKYSCIDCKRKINSSDLEEIFTSQISKLESNLASDNSIENSWPILTPKEKRVLIEQLVSRIKIGRTAIIMEFAFQAHSFKTPTSLQQNATDNKTQNPTKLSENIPSLNEPLMNEADAARFLGISKMTLLRRRNAGEVGFFRVGFRILYSKEKHLIPFLIKCEK